MDCEECKATLYPENPEVGFTDFRSKRYYPPICQGCPNTYQKEEAALKDRVSNLEEISAQPGRIPRQYWNQFQEMRGELAYLRNKVCGESAKPPKKPVLSHGVKL